MIDRRASLLLSILVAAFCAGAWILRFMQDDAYISFRYAKNLADGLGLVWNAGERVEGYTNFFWTVLMAGGIASGIDPVVFAQVLGIGCSACSLIVTYRIAMAIGLTGPMAFVVAALTGLNFSFLSWATGGLETALVTLLCLCGVLLMTGLTVGPGPTAGPGLTVGREGTHRRLLAFSGVMTAALLTRLDAAVVFGPLSALIFIKAVLPADRAVRFRYLAAAFALPAALCVVWFGWKLAYYGDILPNSFHIKASGSGSMDAGFGYLMRFASSYLLLPFLLPFFLAIGAIASRGQEPVACVAAIAALWVGYLAAVGGDFMEFRMMVPVIPLLITLIVWCTVRAVRHPAVRAAAWTLLAAGSLHHATTFTYSPDHDIEDVDRLRRHLRSEEENWEGIGRKLGEIFPGGREVTIAVTAAGAIPFYSGLPAVDMFGLNDPSGEEGRKFVGFMPGHQWMTPYDYLVRRRVNLIISHPMVLKTGDRISGIPLIPDFPAVAAAGEHRQILTMEIGSGYSVAMLYLTPSDDVDAAIANGALAVRTER